jgi:hypothetical protein
MATKVISFLGHNRLSDTTYVFKPETTGYTTSFMAEATARKFMPDQLLVLVTSEARTKNFGLLQERMQDCSIQPTPVDIPSGKSEEELWDIFDIISNQIQTGDSIIFDVTNAFRSLPILAFLAASYIRVARKATVEKMVYGAFDARVDDRTPVFDLTPFIKLLDWTTATSAFLQYGRGEDLMKLVQEPTPAPTRSPASLAEKLKTLTAALQTSRPIEVMEMAHGLGDAIGAYQIESLSARPFGLLLDTINQEYGIFGLDTPLQQAARQEVVKKQLDMITWYRDKGLFVQAITLAREWLVSLVMLDEGGTLSARGDRNRAEKVLRGEREPVHIAASKLTTIQDIWHQTRDVRNDIAHTGMLQNARKAAEVEEQVRKVCNQLEGLIVIRSEETH